MPCLEVLIMNIRNCILLTLLRHCFLYYKHLYIHVFSLFCKILFIIEVALFIIISFKFLDPLKLHDIIKTY